MRVIVATQGHMRMTLPQAMRVRDLGEYIDGPVTVEMCDSDDEPLWPRPGSGWMPPPRRRQRPLTHVVLGMLRERGLVTLQGLAILTHASRRQIDGALQAIRRGHLASGQRIVTRDGVVYLEAETAQQEHRRMAAGRRGPALTLDDVRDWT
jgi:hypothetical protein